MVDLQAFQRYVKEKSPAFVPLFRDKSRYQVVWGGAGCVHPETKIHTEHGLMRICDIDRPMRVLSWNQKNHKFQLSLSGGSFPKGKANLYRISTQHGEFQASGHHLVLLSSGEYRRVDMLRHGDELNRAHSFQPQTIEEYCQKLSREDDRRYTQKDVDLMGGYAALCRQYDPLPRERGDYALFSVQEQVDAQEHVRSCLTLTYNQMDISQMRSHPCLCDGRTCKNHFAQVEQRSACVEEDHSEASSFERTWRSRQEPQQFQQMIELHRTAGQSFESEQELRDFSVDSYIPPKVKESTVLSSTSLVKSIELCDESEYWCMQVVDTNNYISEDGSIHHNSGKSHIVARKLLYRLLQEDHAKHNILVMRKVDRTVKKSVWTLIKNIISTWGLTAQFKFNETDRTMTYKPTGAQFMFSGLDDVEKIKSIERVTSIWLEEATEFLQEDFEQLDLRLRGDVGCLKQIILTFNPISNQHWVKKMFFDAPIQDVFTLHTTYLDNAFIDDEYKMVMENKKKSNPRYYKIYALGQWGTAEGLIFSNVKYLRISAEDVRGLKPLQGLDFGYTNDPTAFNLSYIDHKNKRLYVYDGFYEFGMSNEAIAQKLKDMGYHKFKTVCDSSEPKSIDALKAKGVNAVPAKKGPDSIRIGLDFLLDYEIIVNSDLPEFKTEFENYSWQVKDGKQLNKPCDDFNHFIDSLRYATESEHAPTVPFTRPKVNYAC